MAPFVDRDKCKGCKHCINFCPVESIMLREKKAYITIDCVECGACINECPSQAIHYL